MYVISTLLAWEYIGMWVHAYMCNIRINTYTFTRRTICVKSYINRSTYTHIPVFLDLHMYIHTYIHTYMHAYVPVFMASGEKLKLDELEIYADTVMSCMCESAHA